jgi:hypothetical protein
MAAVLKAGCGRSKLSSGKSRVDEAETTTWQMGPSKDKIPRLVFYVQTSALRDCLAICWGDGKWSEAETRKRRQERH